MFVHEFIDIIYSHTSLILVYICVQYMHIILLLESERSTVLAYCCRHRSIGSTCYPFPISFSSWACSSSMYRSTQLALSVRSMVHAARTELDNQVTTCRQNNRPSLRYKDRPQHYGPHSLTDRPEDNVGSAEGPATGRHSGRHSRLLDG